MARVRARAWRQKIVAGTRSQSSQSCTRQCRAAIAFEPWILASQREHSSALSLRQYTTAVAVAHTSQFTGPCPSAMVGERAHVSVGPARGRRRGAAPSYETRTGKKERAWWAGESTVALLARLRLARMQIFVKLSNGDKHDLQVEASETVVALKRRLAAVASLPEEQQRLVYQGRVLQDTKTLGEYGLEEGHVVHAVRSRRDALASRAPDTQPCGTGARECVTSVR